MSTYMRDVTATYNGGSDVSICTLRAESGFQDHQAPMLANRPISREILTEMRLRLIVQRKDGMPTMRHPLGEPKGALWKTKRMPGELSKNAEVSRACTSPRSVLPSAS
jgi:hypothetical protein